MLQSCTKTWRPTSFLRIWASKLESRGEKLTLTWNLELVICTCMTSYHLAIYNVLPPQPLLCCVLTLSWSLNVTKGTSQNASWHAAGEQRAWIPFPCSFMNVTGFSFKVQHEQTAGILQMCLPGQFSTTVSKPASAGCFSADEGSRNPIPRLPLEVFYSGFSKVDGELQPWAGCYLKAFIYMGQSSNCYGKQDNCSKQLASRKQAKNSK